MNPDFRISPAALKRAALTLGFVVYVYAAMIWMHAATQPLFDHRPCVVESTPCSIFQDNMTFAMIAWVISMVLIVAAIFLYVCSLLYARRPGRGNTSLIQGALAVLLVAASFVLSVYGMSAP